MALLQLNAVSLAFGEHPLLDDVNVSIERGERLCLLGRNGSGKSTLMRIVHGSLEPDSGRVIKQSSTRVAMLDQRVPVGLSGRVEEVVASGAGCLPHRPTELHRARAAISRAGLNPDEDVSSMSAGLRRRVLIASALASDAEILLLDEPTNHLDLDSIAWLESMLTRQEKTLLFVTHDRAFLRRLSTGILDLDRGRLQRHEADYDKYLERKRGSLDAEARGNAQFDKKMAQEEVWIRKGVRERRKRNIGRVSRLMEMRDEFRARRGLSGSAKITVQDSSRTGRMVVEAKGLGYSWGEQVIAKELTTTVMRGDRIGIIGPNGSGKTTLIRLLLGELEPETGTVRQGTNLQIAYFDQLHATLDEKLSMADNIGDGSSTITINGKPKQVIAYLADFLFTSDQARNPITRLSGGERNRLLLARLFARPSNVLVLDEPTNDLDVETLEVLEELLSNYDGTVLVVSHDRELLDNVVTSTMVMEPGGVIHEYAGGYTDWLAQRKPAKKKSKKGKGKKQAPKSTEPTNDTPSLTKDERKELRTLPALIEKLETQQATLHEKMAAPAFFQQSGDAINAAKKQLADLKSEITTTYARWEELESR